MYTKGFAAEVKSPIISKSESLGDPVTGRLGGKSQNGRPLQPPVDWPTEAERDDWTGQVPPAPAAAGLRMVKQ